MLPIRPPVFDDDISPVLSERCVPCHEGDAPAAGYRIDTYLDAVACVEPSGAPATLPTDDTAPIVAALSNEDHAGVVEDDERELLREWVSAGAPAREGAAHPPGFVDPRSEDFHARRLRAVRWAPMLDAEARGACARCHEGATPGERETGTAPGATPCTTCHDEPEGVLACSTCHGSEGMAQPPRDPCFFPGEEAAAGAHDAHVGVGIDCAVCHGVREIAGLAAGSHGDGVVDIAFDPARAGPDAAWDPAARSCTVACHARGGARPTPAWNVAGPLGCGDCHESPPADHYPGACTRCHAEPNEDGTALTPGPLHANGQVDRGDGSGGCSACHGADGDPRPLDPRHEAHLTSALTANVDCDACHVVPADVLDPGHLDATIGAEIAFGTLASARGAMPVYDARTCTDVACHGAGLDGGSLTAPSWDDATGAAGECGACHGIPPPPPHITASTCAASGCHGREIAQTPDGPVITEVGRALHIDGDIDVGGGS